MCNNCHCSNSLRTFRVPRAVDTLLDTPPALVRVSASSSVDSEPYDLTSEMSIDDAGELPTTEGRYERDTRLPKSLDPVSEGSPSLIDSGGYNMLGVPIVLRTEATAPIDDIIFNALLKGMKDES